MIMIRYANESDKKIWYGLDRHLEEKEYLNKVNLKQGYVLFEGEKLVGILRYNLFWDSIPFCNLIFIDSDYRSRGYGKMLLSYWENDMKNQGYKIVMTSTQIDENAQHFYRHLGYKENGCLLLDISNFAQPMEVFMIKKI